MNLLLRASLTQNLLIALLLTLCGAEDNKALSDGSCSGNRMHEKGDVFHDIDSNNAVRTVSENHNNGQITTVCWVEHLIINEFKNGTRNAHQEYSILLETPADIPEEQVDNGGFEEYEIFNEETKKSRVLNFSTVLTNPDFTVKKHRSFRCGSGPTFTKTVLEFPNKKLIEIKVTPKNLNTKSKLLVDPEFKGKSFQVPNPNSDNKFIDVPPFESFQVPNSNSDNKFIEVPPFEQGGLRKEEQELRKKTWTRQYEDQTAPPAFAEITTSTSSPSSDHLFENYDTARTPEVSGTLAEISTTTESFSKFETETPDPTGKVEVPTEANLSQNREKCHLELTSNSNGGSSKDKGSDKVSHFVHGQLYKSGKMTGSDSAIPRSTGAETAKVKGFFVTDKDYEEQTESNQNLYTVVLPDDIATGNPRYTYYSGLFDDGAGSSTYQADALPTYFSQQGGKGEPDNKSRRKMWKYLQPSAHAVPNFSYRPNDQSKFDDSPIDDGKWVWKPSDDNDEQTASQPMYTLKYQGNGFGTDDRTNYWKYLQSKNLRLAPPSDQQNFDFETHVGSDQAATGGNEPTTVGIEDSGNQRIWPKEGLKLSNSSQAEVALNGTNGEEALGSRKNCSNNRKFVVKISVGVAGDESQSESHLEKTAEYNEDDLARDQNVTNDDLDEVLRKLVDFFYKSSKVSSHENCLNSSTDTAILSVDIRNNNKNVSSISNRFLSKVEDFTTDLKENISPISNRFLEKMEDFTTNVKESFAPISNRFLDKMEDLKTNVKENISPISNRFMNKMEDFTTDLKEKVKQSQLIVNRNYDVGEVQGNIKYRSDIAEETGELESESSLAKLMKKLRNIFNESKELV